MVISIYILAHAGIEIPKAIHILMQGVPQETDVTEVTTGLQQVDGVRNVHHVHIWHIDEHRLSLEAHVVIDRADMDQLEDIKGAIKARLSTDFGIGHSTLEFEFPDKGDAPLGADAPAH